MSYLPCVEIEPQSTADAAIIWLHGLGADGHDFEPIVPELGLPAAAAIRFIFPHAPSIPVTINGGYVMPAWYDIIEASIERKVDIPQLMASAQAIVELIDRERERGIESSRILVAGFSQGGAVAIQAALTYSQPLAGLLGLSTYFATKDCIEPHSGNSRLPIRLYHGDHDPMVPERIGREGYDALSARGYDVEYKTYPMEHSVCMEEIQEIGYWIKRWLLN